MDLDFKLFKDIFVIEDDKNESYVESSFSLNILKYSDWHEIYFSYYFDQGVSVEKIINSWLETYGLKIIDSQYPNIIKSQPQFYNPLHWLHIKTIKDVKNNILFKELKTFNKNIIKNWFVENFKKWSDTQMMQFSDEKNIKSKFNLTWLQQDNINMNYLEEIKPSSKLVNSLISKKIILCKIDYYEKYDGSEQAQKIYNSSRDYQYEKTNFLNINGYCYGYVQAPGGGQGFNEKYTNKDIVIIFISHNNNDGKWYVIGYYDDARVYSTTYQEKLPNGKSILFNCKTEFKNAYLIPSESRIPINHPDIPNKIKSGNFNYLEEESSLKDWATNLYDDLHNYNIHNDLINESDEEIYQSQSNDCSASKTPKTQRVTSEGYVRDPNIAGRAIRLSNHKCEWDNSHFSFTDKNGNMFVEAHHLIPMQLQKEMPDTNLDIVENIVTLCPNCHRAIHKSNENHKMIERLFNERKDSLKAKGIDISINDLMKSKCY